MYFIRLQIPKDKLKIIFKIYMREALEIGTLTGFCNIKELLTFLE